MAAHENRLVETQFFRGSFEHFRFVGALGHQPINSDLLRLADSMRSSSGLNVILGVPVTIVDDHDLRGCQVDPLTSSFG